MGDRVKSLGSQMQKQGYWGVIPPNRNYVYYAPIPVPYFPWKGFVDCAHTAEVTIYTPRTTLLLAVGTILYANDRLTAVYSNPFFVFNGIRYTIETGEITNLILCSIYDI